MCSPGDNEPSIDLDHFEVWAMPESCSFVLRASNCFCFCAGRMLINEAGDTSHSLELTLPALATSGDRTAITRFLIVAEGFTIGRVLVNAAAGCTATCRSIPDPK